MLNRADTERLEALVMEPSLSPSSHRDCSQQPLTCGLPLFYTVEASTHSPHPPLQASCFRSSLSTPKAGLGPVSASQVLGSQTWAQRPVSGFFVSSQLLCPGHILLGLLLAFLSLR